MALIGVIAELNPLHRGHEFLIKEAKKKGPVICALSGNFVQRGEVALAEKGLRARAALEAGADMVIELPVMWSMSTAQNFALGGVFLLKNAGCDSIMFGSEAGDIKELEGAAEILLSDRFSKKVMEKSALGITFAKARQEAAEELGLKNGILDRPNNNLGVEYMVAAARLGYGLGFQTVKRRGAQHDSLKEEELVSASLLRSWLLKGKREECLKYMPEYSLEMCKSEGLASIERLETAVLAALRMKSAEDFKALPDLAEGLENKLFYSVRKASSLEELYSEIKVKRYTQARIRRLVLSAFLGLDSSFFMKKPPYLRVLGFSAEGERLLKKINAQSDIPVITKAADIKNLNDECKKVFEAECRATDVFGLATEKALPCGLEYTRKMIKTEN